MVNKNVLVELLGKVGEQSVKIAEELRVEYFKSYKQDVDIWNKEMVPNFNYVRLAVMSVYSTGKSFGDFSQEQVENVINTQPRWEKSINNLAQLAATKIVKK